MIITFLQTLRETGQSLIDPPEDQLLDAVLGAGKETGQQREMNALLQSWYDEDILFLPGPPLKFHPGAAAWGALLLFRAACFHSFREIVEAEVERGMSQLTMPDPDLPESHFSADLTLRHLPGLLNMINRIDHEDGLAVLLKESAGQAPLSSVGMEIEIPPESIVLQHEGLIQLLAERALRQKCRTTFRNPVIREIAVKKLGRFADDLCDGMLIETNFYNES